MITWLLIQKIASLFLIMAAGFAIVRLGLLKSEDSKTLSVLSVYAICPCAILSAFQVDFTQDVVEGFALAVVASLVLQVLIMGVVKLLSYPLHLSPLERMTSVYSNSFNLILPLVGFCLGDEWSIYALAYMSVQTLFMWTHGRALVKEERGLDPKRLFTNINLIAIVVGFCLFVSGIRFEGPLEVFVTDIGEWIGPAAMLITGMIVGGMKASQVLANKRVWLVTAVRLVVVPLLVTLALKFCGAGALVTGGESILFIVLLATATPSASTSVMMAQIYDKDAPYASAINVVSTLCCIVTMPLWVALYFC